MSDARFPIPGGSVVNRLCCRSRLVSPVHPPMPVCGTPTSVPRTSRVCDANGPRGESPCGMDDRRLWPTSMCWSHGAPCQRRALHCIACLRAQIRHLERGEVLDGVGDGDDLRAARAASGPDIAQRRRRKWSGCYLVVRHVQLDLGAAHTRSAPGLG
eukprot:321676-Rhodomonas_salina.1